MRFVPSPGATVAIAESADELRPFISAWQDLASAAIEPNVFYEPWMLEPAIRLLGSKYDLRFVLILAAEPGSSDHPPEVWGFFPLELRSNYKRLPVRTIRLWAYEYCFLCVPLLRKGRAREALGAFIDWLVSNPFGCKLMEFGHVVGDGSFHMLLGELLADRRRLNLVEGWYARPLLRRSRSAEAYLDQAISRKHQKDLQKKEQRLSQAGKIEYLALQPGGELEKWITGFMALEASGWKGRKGAAFAQCEPDTHFFRAIVRDAFQQGRLMMLGLYLGSEPIALKCNFVCGSGSFAFKIAYDENYAKLSPGLLLEIENIRRIHADLRIEWMDSCTANRPDSMFNRIWADHRVIQTVLVSNGSRASDLWISVIPLLRWFKRTLTPHRQGAEDRASSDSSPGSPNGAVRSRVARGDSSRDVNGQETYLRPGRNLVCQVEEQESYSFARRPAIVYGPSGILRRLAGPLGLLGAVRRSLHDRGLLSTLKKSVLVSAAKMRARLSENTQTPRKTSVCDGEVLDLQPGELVEVKSLKEILQTLDDNDKHKGLAFTSEMNAYCGRRYRVFRRLERLFNEYTREQRSVRNTVLLEGVFCQGTGFGCDRLCFHFWREIWLTRVREHDSANLALSDTTAGAQREESPQAAQGA